jgi:ribonuclease Z
MMDVCLLGCGGMMPLPERKLSALLCRTAGGLILVDCGEGTQVQIKRAGWGFKGIRAICFTHMHADHIAGLPGLLLTLANSGKTEPLILIGPPGLLQVVRGLTVIVPALPYELIILERTDTAEAFCMGDIFLRSVPADHGIPCLAYSLEVRRPGRFDVSKAQALGLPVIWWNRLQRGERIEYKGKEYRLDMVLGPPRKGIKISYCTDTRPTDAVTELCSASDLLVCEGIYGEDERRAEAAKKKHMTFGEAAELAARGGCGALWLTHFSPSLKKPEDFLASAQRIFKNVSVGYDLKKTTIVFDKNETF